MRCNVLVFNHFCSDCVSVSQTHHTLGYEQKNHFSDILLLLENSFLTLSSSVAEEIFLMQDIQKRCEWLGLPKEVK